MKQPLPKAANPFSFKKFVKEKKSSHSNSGAVKKARKPRLPETDSSQSLSDEDSESVPFPSVDLEQQQSGSDLLPPVDAMPLVQHHPSSSDLPPLVDSHQIVQDTSSSSSASTDTFSEPEEEEGPHVPFHNHTSGKMVEELTTEKEQLLAELAVAKQLLSNERKKCRALEKKVVVLKEKEKQEAQALAAMVQKAEANLKLTTNRAVTAESKVTQLRKEVLVLQTKLAKQQSSSVNQHYEALLETVREKASQGSQQITQSADRAESMLKDLLVGVQSLRQLSDILMSIDKIVEVRDQPTS